MSALQGYRAMDPAELDGIRTGKVAQVKEAQDEIRKLKKKFKSGHYDRQVICEHIIGLQHRIEALILSVEGINQILDAELVPTGS